MTLPPGVDADQRPSVKLVATALHQEGPLSRAELVDETGLGETTVKRALGDLAEEEIIAQTRENRDLRRVQYQFDTDS